MWEIRFVLHYLQSLISSSMSKNVVTFAKSLLQMGETKGTRIHISFIMDPIHFKNGRKSHKNDVLLAVPCYEILLVLESFQSHFFFP